MAQNRELKLQYAVFSSEEDEGSHSIGSSDSDTEAEDSVPVTRMPDSEKSDTHEASNDDEIEKVEDSDPISKLVVSKRQNPPKRIVRKPRSKPNSPSSSTPVKSGAGSKRPAEREPIESKRGKKKGPVEENIPRKGDGQKKQLFQRLWSEEDEIAILKGVMDYVGEKGTDPGTDMDGFLNFIKNSIHVNVTKTQLRLKVRRLRKKFENNVGKGKKKFSKAHEQKAFDLSKKIWTPAGVLLEIDSSKGNQKNLNQKAGKSGASGSGDGLSRGKGKVVVGRNASSGKLSNQRRNVLFGTSVGCPALEEEILKDGLDLIEGSERTEIEEKWKRLRMEEVELYLKLVDLMRDQTVLVLREMKSGGN